MLSGGGPSRRVRAGGPRGPAREGPAGLRTSFATSRTNEENLLTIQQVKDTRDDPRVKLPARTREVDLPSGTVLPSVPAFTEKVVGRVPAPSRAPRATESAVRRRADSSAPPGSVPLSE